MLLWELIVLAFLALWLALSVVYQFHLRSWPWLRRWDPLQLVPKWTFFAPNPGRTDLHLFYRDVYADDVCGEWTLLPLALPRGPAVALWHPTKRGKKILLDAVQSLFAVVEEITADGGDPHPVKITVPYLLLLQVVTALPREPCPQHGAVLCRQFQLVESYGYCTELPPLVIFRSEAHAV